MTRGISWYTIIKSIIYFQVFVLIFNAYQNFSSDDSFLTSNNNTLEASLLIAASIVFFHLLLWPILFNLGHTLRPLTLRTIDCVWYSGAVISAIIAANDIQSTSINSAVKSRIEKMISFHDQIYDLRSSAEEACSDAVPNLDKADNIMKFDRQAIVRFCSDYNFTSDSLPLIDDDKKCSLFSQLTCPPEPNREACRAIISMNERSDAINEQTGEMTTSPPKPLESHLSSDLTVNFALKRGISRMYKLCKLEDEYDHDVFVGRQLIKAKNDAYLPDKTSSHWWIYLLAAVIGLRFTRSTAEVYEASAGLKSKKSGGSKA